MLEIAAFSLLHLSGWWPPPRPGGSNNVGFVGFVGNSSVFAPPSFGFVGNVGNSSFFVLPPRTTSARAPGPGPIRLVEYANLAKVHLKNKQVIFHTDGAKACTLKVPGVLHDHVVHKKKKVMVQGRWRWVKPPGGKVFYQRGPLGGAPLGVPLLGGAPLVEDLPSRAPSKTPKTKNSKKHKNQTNPKKPNNKQNTKNNKNTYTTPQVTLSSANT